MREILFRAKRVKKYCATQNWTYGVPFIDHEGDCIFKTASTEFVVDPETVGQYTGLTDKNGKKIFEGDIVKTKEFGRDSGKGVNFNDYDVFEVIYSNAAYKVNNRRRQFNLVCGQKYEVIGNIHDNPELLEGGVK